MLETLVDDVDNDRNTVLMTLCEHTPWLLECDWATNIIVK